MLRWGLWVIYAFTAVHGRPAFAQTNPSVAFFDGKPVPVGQPRRFDWVVVEPDHLDARGLDELQRAGVQVFAYPSLGEAAPEVFDPGWILGRNGLFLDTLDSHAMVLRADARRAAVVAMAGLIRDISDHHRDVKLLFDEAVLTRLFDLDLATGDLPGALRTAGRLVSLAPAEPRSHRRVAQVAEWAARPRAPRSEARLEASMNDLAPESAALLAQAVRTRAGGSLAAGSTRFYARAAGEAKLWSMRSGTRLARGAAGTLELGAHLRLPHPEINLRLQGGYQRNDLAVAMPGAPILPDQLATVGVGLSAARWTVGPTTLLLDAWLGELTRPRRLAHRAQPGLAIQPFGGAELSPNGYVANDNWMIGRGERGMTASLTYRFTPPES